MKRFRFSLLSLLVGVVLAGGVVTVNLHPGTPYRYDGFLHAYEEDGFYPIEPFISWVGNVHPYGWPFVAYKVYGDIWRADVQRFEGWQWPGLAADIAIGLAIVFGGAGVCEWLVRRRARIA